MTFLLFVTVVYDTERLFSVVVVVVDDTLGYIEW